MLSIAIAVACLTLFSCLALKIVSEVQNEPYMDEIFHVPQAQQYCAHNFSSWDPMITTLPGLYLSAVLFLQPLASIQGTSLINVCSTFNLRAVNLVFCCGNFILLFFLSKKLNKESLDSRKSESHHALHALVLIFFPVLYFFSWMFYTDPGSTFFTLLLYLCCLHDNHLMAAMAGSAAVMFRQTNIVWVIYCLGLTKAQVLHEQLRFDKKIRGDPSRLGDFEVFKLLVTNVFSSVSRLMSLALLIVQKTFWYLFVVFGFAVFVYVNKGLVVGDRSHHQASYNFPQLFYFLLISLMFSFIHVIHPSKVKSFAFMIFRNPFKVLVFFITAVYLIRNFTYEHIYLLSDNRHYTFYFWGKLFRRHELVKYALVPVYLYSLNQFYCLTRHKEFLWRVCFAVCCCAALIPASLLEFRYFIIPFYLLRLNMRVPCRKSLVVEVLFYSLINVASVYMFLSRPFYWADSPHPQRFMW